MISNPKMAVECTDVANNSVLRRAERIYSKQRQLQNVLIGIDNAMTGHDPMIIPEVNSDCVMAYLDEAEAVLNSTLDLAHDMMQCIR